MLVYRHTLERNLNPEMKNKIYINPPLITQLQSASIYIGPLLAQQD